MSVSGPSHNDVLRFWFEEATPKQWFGKDVAFDETIRRRFADPHRRAAHGETSAWRDTPEGRLAEIIVLDQFSRNLFRDSAEAFACDATALALAEDAIRHGADKRLPADRRVFLYMPFMHSESRPAHRRAVWLFVKLLPRYWGFLRFELRHKRIIDRFGRYPHRNEVLGRTSTPEERAFLEAHGGF